MSNNSGRFVLSNLIWRFLERTGAQVVSFVVSVVLARILSPTAYGTVALINVFINLMTVFISSGFSSALIQKKDADDTDFSSVFYVQMGICITMYLVLFFAAPAISAFYKKEMTAMIRVLGLTLIVAGVKNVQIAYVSKNMMFKRFFFATLGGTIGAAFVGIGMAVAGLGTWALIGQSLFNNTVDTIILWVTVKWRPKKTFSFRRVKGLFSYGWKMLASSLLERGYSSLRTLVIGKMYSSEDLAFYEKGQGWPLLVMETVNSSIDSVLLPSMSAEQDDRARVKAMTRRAIKTSTYLMMPMMMGVAVCARPLVSLILTDKWLPSVFFMQIFCISYAFYPIHTANLNAIKAMGRSDLFLKLEILKKVVGMILLLSTMWISVEAMAYSLLVSSITSQIINAWPNRKLLNYSYLEQVKDMLPSALLATIMGLCVYPIQLLGLSDGITLCVMIPMGVIVYVGLSFLCKIDSFTYLLNIAKPNILKIFHKN